MTPEVSLLYLCIKTVTLQKGKVQILGELRELQRRGGDKCEFACVWEREIRM